MMPNQAHVVRTPGWMVLTQQAAEIAGLAVISRLLEPPRPKWGAAPRKRTLPKAPPPAVRPEPPALPPFISEVVDADAHRYRARLNDGSYVFCGFYSDGRVRMATATGKRISGIMVEQKAVMADLHEDSSFEMNVAVHAHAGDQMMLTMDGGPFDGQELLCEMVA